MRFSALFYIRGITGSIPAVHDSLTPESGAVLDVNPPSL